jgi:hypothetical protein
MKLLKTISKLVIEAQIALERASENGVPEKELDRLEKNYKESLKLYKLYTKIQKKD